MEKERETGRDRPENAFSFVFVHICFFLLSISPFSGELGRKETGKPYYGGMVVRGLLWMTPDGDRIW